MFFSFCCFSINLNAKVLTGETQFIPSENYEIPHLTNINMEQGTNVDFNSYLSEDNIFISYSNFVDRIISNSKKLDVEIVKMVDENFWDLLL